VGGRPPWIAEADSFSAPPFSAAPRPRSSGLKKGGEYARPTAGTRANRNPRAPPRGGATPWGSSSGTNPRRCGMTPLSSASSGKPRRQHRLGPTQHVAHARHVGAQGAVARTTPTGGMRCAAPGGISARCHSLATPPFPPRQRSTSWGGTPCCREATGANTMVPWQSARLDQATHRDQGTTCGNRSSPSGQPDGGQRKLAVDCAGLVLT